MGRGSAVRGGMAEPDRGGGAVRRACAGAPLAGVGKLGPRRRLPPACKGRRQDLCGKRSAPPARRWCGSSLHAPGGKRSVPPVAHGALALGISPGREKRLVAWVSKNPVTLYVCKYMM